MPEPGAGSRRQQQKRALIIVALLAHLVEAETPTCLVTAGERSFDLSGLAAPVRHVSQESDSLGWAYSFSACGDVPPSVGGPNCGGAPRSAVLQQTVGECHGLGAYATRKAAASAKGVVLSFGGGESCGGASRSTAITIECADVPKPKVVRAGHGKDGCSYVLIVRARAGCAAECGRDATGAVCGGAARGACTGDGAIGPTRCTCTAGHSGVACVDGETISAAPPAAAKGVVAVPGTVQRTGSGGGGEGGISDDKLGLQGSPLSNTTRGFTLGDALLAVGLLAGVLFATSAYPMASGTVPSPFPAQALARSVAQVCSRDRVLPALLLVLVVASLFAPELGAVAWVATLRVHHEDKIRVGSVGTGAHSETQPGPRVSSLEGGPLWQGPSPYSPNFPGEPLVGPTVGAVYLTYQQPKAFLNSMAAFRAAYPDGDMVLFCDVGCHNYSHAARYFGAHYFSEPRAFTTKNTKTIDMRKSEAAVYLQAMREAVNIIKSPYFMHMETDVFVLRRVKEDFLHQVNGWAYDKRIVGKADAYVRSVTGNFETELVLGGFGGSIYETAFWRRVLNNEADMEDFLARYFDPVSGYTEIGHDYVVSSILFSRNGTMGNYEGFSEWFHGDLVKRLLLGSVSVYHGFKHLYNNNDLTEGELAILGPDWMK